jgi:hypothetical protein
MTVAGSDSAISTAIGVNGWITFTGGVVLVLLGGLMLVSSDRSLRWLALVVSFASLGFAIFDVVRIVDGISKDRSSVSKLGAVGLKIAGSESIGFGLILLL